MRTVKIIQQRYGLQTLNDTPNEFFVCAVELDRPPNLDHEEVLAGTPAQPRLLHSLSHSFNGSYTGLSKYVDVVNKW
jgi:hypothetical protein